MTKNNLISLIVLFYFSISFGQQKDTIYGKVKSIREQLNFIDKNRQNMKLFNTEGDYGHYGFSSPKFTNSRFHYWWYNTPWVHYTNYYKVLNKKGKPTYEIWFYKNRDTVSFFNYKYDKNDNLIQIKETYEKEDYTVKNFNYNKKNKLVSTIYYLSDDPNKYSYSEFIYDESDNLVQSKDFDEDGETFGTKYSFYPNGKIKEVFSHSPYKIKKENNKKVSFKDGIGSDQLNRKYIYNERGDIKETYSFKDELYSNDKPYIQGRTLKEYENGLLIKEMTLNRANKTERFTLYSYNENNLITKEEKVIPEYTDNNLIYEYFYDKNGNQIKLIYSEKNNPITVKFEYEFDSKKNWTKQIKSVNGEKLFVWTREIEYFE